ncbi:hypothetical protein LCGC14_0165070 [marine sediment metagenome]|uniref:Uncharacterized protein n=1 Tax=marine sediment metagenome TaxID=412755 RepID=A0A0F9XWR6_9ZZZZ
MDECEVHKAQAFCGPALSVKSSGVTYNGKFLNGVYLCKAHRSGLIRNKYGEFTTKNVTWKADPKNGYWIACCQECRKVLKDAHSKRFVCPIEEPQPEE